MKWSLRHRKIEIDRTKRFSQKNPMFPKQSWKLFVIQKLDSFVLSIILILLVIIYIFFYSPLFEIKYIYISGNQNISSDVLEEKLIKWQLQQRRFIIFKQKNILLFSKGWLKERLKSEYEVDQVNISKKLPNTLTIELHEQLPSLIWKTGDDYYYLDQNGNYAQEANMESLLTELITVQDESNESLNKNKQVINKNKLDFIKNLDQKIKEVQNIEISAYSMTNNATSQVNAITVDGWKIYFESSHDLDQQIFNLTEVLTKKIDSTQSLEYIDLKIDGRVYYK